MIQRAHRAPTAGRDDADTHALDLIRRRSAAVNPIVAFVDQPDDRDWVAVIRHEERPLVIALLAGLQDRQPDAPGPGAVAAAWLDADPDRGAGACASWRALTQPACEPHTVVARECPVLVCANNQELDRIVYRGAAAGLICLAERGDAHAASHVRGRITGGHGDPILWMTQVVTHAPRLAGTAGIQSAILTVAAEGRRGSPFGDPDERACAERILARLASHGQMHASSRRSVGDRLFQALRSGTPGQMTRVDRQSIWTGYLTAIGSHLTPRQIDQLARSWHAYAHGAQDSWHQEGGKVLAGFCAARRLPVISAACRGMPAEHRSLLAQDLCELGPMDEDVVTALARLSSPEQR